MDIDTGVPQDEKLRLANKFYLLTCSDVLAPDKGAIKAEIMKSVEENGMSEWYRHFASLDKSPLQPRDDVLIERLSAANSTKLETIEAKIVDMEENMGESEVRDARMEKASFLDDTGDKAKALAAYGVVEGDEKTPGAVRIDCCLAKIRIGLTFTDRELTAKSVKECQVLVENGGDWERRNRLKVYEAVHLISNREFKQAADLLLSSLATFTCTELIDMNTLIFYTVICSIITLDRVQLKEKVLNAAEVLTCILEIPRLSDFLNSLYKCDYGLLFDAFPTIADHLKSDRHLVSHVKFFEREMCVVAYSQFLQSYRSVTTESMASAFGVSIGFIDGELSRFISTGRINAKIDKVNGVVETNRPDAKNALYQDAIKKGDQLLNRIQKLSRVINV